MTETLSHTVPARTVAGLERTAPRSNGGSPPGRSAQPTARDVAPLGRIPPTIPYGLESPDVALSAPRRGTTGYRCLTTRTGHGA
jgi:hypothetical protein